MKVILKENVESLGKMGDVIKVADGYGRNFLIPKGLAMEASSLNLKTLEQERQSILQKAAKERKVAETLAQTLTGVTCTISRRAGEQEKLFGSVGTKDIEQALREQGLKVDKKTILLDEPIKSIGEYPVKVKLGSGMTAEIKVLVVAESL
jgi:large subunit ribosomal protein L9